MVDLHIVRPLREKAVARKAAVGAQFEVVQMKCLHPSALRDPEHRKIERFLAPAHRGRDLRAIDIGCGGID